MISIAERRLDELEGFLSREWHTVRERAALVVTLAAEHMRALVYGRAVTEPYRTAVPTIHTTRLLICARRAIEGLWPEYRHHARIHDLCAETLKQMALIGDMVDTGSGHWLAAPLRIVGSTGRERYLVVGAAPAEAVYRRLGIAPACSGASRFVGAAVLRVEGNDDLLLSADAWIGDQPPIATWTSQLLAVHERRMQAVEGLSAEHLEIYAPDVTHAQRKAGRWIIATQIGRPLEGPRLCRPQERYARSWDRPFYLAHFGFKGGALTLRRSAFVQRDLTLRLRFGLDVILKRPRRLSMVHQRETFSIEPSLMLPEPETRIYGLGWKDRPLDGDSNRITFHADALPFVMRALERLAVQITITGGAPR